jgi:pimeloyl-ACP methyl ester carboxylesterase
MLGNIQLDENALWKQRFRTPVVAWTQVALANPTCGLAATNISGRYQLHAWDVPVGMLRQLTDRPTGIMDGVLSGDGRYVYFLDDEQGNEIGHFSRIPFEGGESQDITPDLPLYSPGSFSSSGSGSHFGFTGAHEEGFNIYSVETKANGVIGMPRRLFHSAKLVWGPIYSYGGEVAIVAANERASMLHWNLLAFDTASGAQIAELWDGIETSILFTGFSPLPGDFRMAGTTNRSGVTRSLIWNPCTGERTDLDLPDLAGDISPVDWSPDANRLLLCQFAQAIQQLYLYDITTQTLTKLNPPSGTFGFFGGPGTYFGPGGEIFAQWQDATHPSQLIALDERTGEKTRTVLAAGPAPAGRPWKSITFPSSDGQMIQGWLGVPEGKGPFPTILHTHGGPEMVMTEMFSPGGQCWLDHGFAFLTINYRGSTTFGREFQEKIWGNVGYWENEDMVAARDWLIGAGIANPCQILLTGWSYGGYLTLLGLGKRPDLWAGGMAGVASADWVLQYEDESEGLRGYDRSFFGGSPEEKPEQYAVASPITYAEAVRVPVLIIQGRNDTRCPARQVEVYEAKMKALGKAIEVHWFDAGHIRADIERDIQNNEIMLRFAYKVLA